MTLLVKIRNLLYIIRIFYWFAFKAVVKGYLNGSVHLAQEFWAKQTWTFLQSKLYKCLNSQELRRQKTMILSNHRSQADFWVHNIITEYTCNFLSRLAVGVVFFVFGIFANKTVWFFNRSGNIDHNKFNEWLTKKFSTSPKPSLLAYPEGHRMPGTEKVDRSKLKTGMMKYAYRQKIPVQILMTFGNELIFNEKKLHFGWNQKVYYSFSRVYNPETFETQRQFVEYMKGEFCKFFDQIWKLYSEGGRAQQMHPVRQNAD